MLTAGSGDYVRKPNDVLNLGNIYYLHVYTTVYYNVYL